MLLVCRVVLGRMLVNRDVKPDPARVEQECTENYDSLCGDRNASRGTYREFIVYNSNQAYPAYIVKYRRKPEADFTGGMKEPRADAEKAVLCLAHASRLMRKHPDQIVRYRLSLALGLHVVHYVPAIVACLQDRRGSVRRFAARLPGELSGNKDMTKEGKLALRSAVQALSPLLDDQDASVREAAEASLAKASAAGL
eukprot:TRINITY_DN37548_c0_g1_i2.p1 TRINITY_DN37548_c0_g1~~TRINITY_DN37548_c0_g1_i2.p1  ORF type:complete len:197 (+),score=45.01 TRINITY_DN37548_c0_g1_i2:198-788(+)